MLNTSLEDYALDSDLPTTTSSVTQSSADVITSGGVYSALSGYLETGDNAGGVTMSTSSAKIRSQSSNIKLQTGSSYTTRLEVGTSGTIGINKNASTEQLEVNGTVKANDFKFQYLDGVVSVADLYTSVASLPGTTTAVTSGSEDLVTSGGVHSKLADYALSTDLPATTSSVTSGSDALVTSSGVASELAGNIQTIPQVDADTLGGVKIDGRNLPINASTGILSALIVQTHSATHVGDFTLQDDTNLSTAVDTFMRWKPALSSQGLKVWFIMPQITYHKELFLRAMTRTVYIILMFSWH